MTEKFLHGGNFVWVEIITYPKTTKVQKTHFSKTLALSMTKNESISCKNRKSLFDS